MKKAIDVRGSIFNITENNGVFECSSNPSIWMSMGETFVADDDMEISCNGKIFTVSKGDIVYSFRKGKGDDAIITFKSDIVANYIKTQIEERNKRNEECIDCCCDKISEAV